MKSYFEAKNLTDLCSLLGLPESEAAKISGMGRTVITAIMNGNLDKISTDRLIDVAQSLGLKLQLKVA